jgi:hypothetical protein
VPKPLSRPDRRIPSTGWQKAEASERLRHPNGCGIRTQPHRIHSTAAANPSLTDCYQQKRTGAPESRFSVRQGALAGLVLRP